MWFNLWLLIGRLTFSIPSTAGENGMHTRNKCQTCNKTPTYKVVGKHFSFFKWLNSKGKGLTSRMIKQTIIRNNFKFIFSFSFVRSPCKGLILIAPSYEVRPGFFSVSHFTLISHWVLIRVFKYVRCQLPNKELLFVNCKLCCFSCPISDHRTTIRVHNDVQVRGCPLILPVSRNYY